MLKYLNVTTYFTKQTLSVTDTGLKSNEVQGGGMIYYKTDQGRMPALGLGTWQLKGQECRDIVKLALDLGYRHIDTAVAYDNEEDVAAGIQASGLDRQLLWITSKIWIDDLHRRDAFTSVEDSLRRLSSDYLDLVLIHWPNDQVPMQETLEAMREMRDKGLVRHIGVSNFTLSQVREARELAPILCNQVECHLFLQQQDMHALLQELGMLLIAYSPLARGDVEQDEAVERLAIRHRATPEQIALAWLLQRQQVAAIPKASSREHLIDNLKSLDIKLDQDDLDLIEGLDRGQRIIDPDFAPAWGT